MKKPATVVVGIVCGIVCAAAVFIYLASVRGEADAARAEALERFGGEQVEVCVATRDIAAGEKVDSSNAMVKLWVADLLPANAVRSLTEVAGERLGSPVFQGEVVTHARFEREDMTMDAPAGSSVISVPVKDVQALGGSVKPGMRVDVYATGASATQLLAANVPVVSSSNDEGGGSISWVALAVDPRSIEELIAASQKNGTVPCFAGVRARRERWMRHEVVLCVDSESAMKPELIGLGGENLFAQPWMRLFCSAHEARSYLREAKGVEEVWIASCDEMDPINLAAAIKKDMQGRGVYLLAFDGGGSLKSRARAAGIDAALSRADFSSRYARRKGGPDGHAQPRLQQKTSLNESPTQARDTNPLDGVRALEIDDRADSTVSERELGATPSGQEYSTALASSPKPVAGSSAGHRAVIETQVRKRVPNLVAVVSASGGSGKSTVAALSAYFLQGFGQKTLLLDADLRSGDLHYLVGDEKPLSIDEVAAGSLGIEQLNRREGHPALLAAPRRLEQSEVLAGELLHIIDRAEACFDVVVVNTSSCWDEQLVRLIERSTHVLFVVDQRASSIRTSKHVLDMCSRCGVATNTFVFAVNRCGKGALFSSFDVACSLGGSNVAELDDGGAEVDELLGAGLPIDLINARNELCLSLERVLVGMMPELDDATTGNGSARSARAKRFAFGRRRRGAACL